MLTWRQLYDIIKTRKIKVLENFQDINLVLHASCFVQEPVAHRTRILLEAPVRRFWQKAEEFGHRMLQNRLLHCLAVGRCP